MSDKAQIVVVGGEEISDYMDEDYSGVDDPAAEVSLRNGEFRHEKLVLDSEDDSVSDLGDSITGESKQSFQQIFCGFYTFLDQAIVVDSPPSQHGIVSGGE